ncbi:Thiosulfate sulfurtransferase PspE precursor [Roseimaritima multifibrata]|uniref:Thiosulfate sulfurtransferase PspE n=1 Tax=Roseimaritima multifibrata TaxID=1930274 RepID=A0A517MAP3_9BACT|nr:rhodanese-like domain-containing protein [Roseimaritima multifibrata]QDS91956.1 Thiosulfate sulfurtransferase PspE precursor [Roseimaritima multifibrata]
MMRTIFGSLVLAMAFGCTPTKPTPSTPADDSAPAVESSDAASAENDGDVYIVDVRSQEEWDGGHIEQAVHIPHTEIADRIGEVTSDKDAKIIFYCAAGGRAGKAKDTLEDLGFTNVENGGGIDDMKERDGI